MPSRTKTRVQSGVPPKQASSLQNKAPGGASTAVIAMQIAIKEDPIQLPLTATPQLPQCFRLIGYYAQVPHGRRWVSALPQDGRWISRILSYIYLLATAIPSPGSCYSRVRPPQQLPRWWMRREGVSAATTHSASCDGAETQHKSV